MVPSSSYQRQVPPPTRGWSPRRDAGASPSGGSPAHAGMVPKLAGGRDGQARFPRPRGDGPGRLKKGYRFLKVPPPTRGWSVIGNVPGLEAAGSPAHAGMVRWHRTNGRPKRGFPRPRGDGPFPTAAPPRIRQVPPPTRGWSPAASDRRARLSGSPAHAGMVPNRANLEIARNWFPRPRGDGPGHGQQGANGRSVPPPTRGWSQRNLISPPLSEGSPAHAGMVPSGSLSPGRGPRFPRPRGDGPSRRSHRPSSRWVPPPTRGWSRRPAGLGGDYAGSPAHAGMVRSSVSDSSGATWFPRPRGDGPLQVQTERRLWEVPPPTRGWSP